MLSHGVICLVVITRNPENQTICVGDTAVMNCGYYSIFLSGHVLIPLAYINGTLYGTYPGVNFPAGLPLQYIALANDTNANRIIVGPVSEQAIGMINFECYYTLIPPIFSTTAVLTVEG